MASSSSILDLPPSSGLVVLHKQTLYPAQIEAHVLEIIPAATGRDNWYQIWAIWWDSAADVRGCILLVWAVKSLKKVGELGCSSILIDWRLRSRGTRLWLARTVSIFSIPRLLTTCSTQCLSSQR
jgi:hypothetical protein